MDTFGEDIQLLSEHLAELKQQVIEQPVAPHTLLQVAFETVSTSLEELRVAEEEMRTQNEILADAQETTEQWRVYYQDLFNAAPDAYLVTDLQGVISEANRSAQRLLGLSVRFLVGKPLAGFVPPASRQEFRRLLLEIGKETDIREHELVLLPRKQAPVSVSATVALIQGQADKPTGLRWLIRDVTERGAAEADRYRRIVEEVTDYAICLLDADGSILSWNSGATRMLGYTPPEALGLHFSVLFRPEDRENDKPARELATAAAAGRTTEEGWLRHKNGSPVWGRGALSVLYDTSGAVRWYVKLVRDETARWQEEQTLLEAFTHEQRIAATFQQSLLPKIAPHAFPNMEIATLYAAASQEALVGGDFFDAFRLEDDRVALVVGDVSGKGLAAAARTAEIKYALRAYLRETPEPAAALTRLSAFWYGNQTLGDGTGEDRGTAFVTLAVIVLHPGTGEARAAAAGAEPPLLVHANGKAEAIPARGMLPGLTREGTYDSHAFRLEPGDTLVLVTDGITEARRGSEFLDYDGLTGLAQAAHPSVSLNAMGQAILAGARDFAGGTLHDDVCLLLARRD